MGWILGLGNGVVFRQGGGSGSGSSYWTRQSKVGDYGTGDGSSYDNAWNGFTSIEWDKIKPGDTLYICGTHDETLSIGASGTELKYITIRGDYGGDAGIIDGEDTRDRCLDVNEKSYIHIEAITLTQAVVSCLHIDGASIVTTKDIIVSESGNQGVQHLNTCQATHTNITALNNVDDGISGHDSSVITVIGATLTGNAEGINIVGSVNCTVTGIVTFSGNTSNDLYATNADSDESCWINITGATIPVSATASNGGKLILNDCIITGALTIATTGTDIGFLTGNGNTYGDVSYNKAATIIDTDSHYTGTNTVNNGIISMSFTGCTFDNNINVPNTTAEDCVFGSVTTIIGTTASIINSLILVWGSNIYGTVTLTGCYIKDNIPVNGTLTTKYCLYEGGADHLLDVVSGGTLTAEYCIFNAMASGKFGIAGRTGSTLMAVDNCTFYDSKKDGKGIFAQVNLTANNCIFTTLATGVHQTAGTVATYNCVFYDCTDVTAGTVTQNASQTGNPNLTNPGSKDFSIGVGSSAMANGKDLGGDKDTGLATAVWGNGTDEAPSNTTKDQAASWDIGAFIH